MKKMLLALCVAACSLASFSATAQTPPVPGVNEATLQWDYTGPVPSGFSLERAAAPATDCTIPTLTFAEVAQPAATARFYLDTNLTRGTTFCYRAFTVGIFPGDKSLASNIAKKTIPPVLTAPANLRIQ